jgi:NitT/TauT family transport system substrate-binding protein
MALVRAASQIASVSPMLVIALICLACSSASAPAKPAGAGSTTLEPKTIHDALVGIGWSTAPETIAQEKGFFAAEKLTVEAAIAGQSAATCQQILAKAADVGRCSLNDMVQAVEASGAPLIQFMGLYAAPLNYSVMAKRDITTWAQLKGKSIIVGGPKDNTVYFFRAMARPNGLQDNDYDFQFAGASAARFAALKSGAVDAAILTDPFDYQAELEGFKKVDALVPRYVNSDNYSYVIHVAQADWAKAHSDELTRYIRAILNSVNWVYDPANKQEMFSIIGPKANMDQESFERLYKRDVVDAHFWSTDGKITDGGVQGVLNSLAELDSLKGPMPAPGKFYDLTYLNLALESMKK